MKSLTWLRYEFTAELRPRVTSPGDDITTEQFPPTDNFVNFTYRSNNSTTIRILAPEAFPMYSALVAITDRDGQQLFANENSSIGDMWQIYHVEPIYDHLGDLIFFLHMARRQS